MVSILDIKLHSFVSYAAVIIIHRKTIYFFTLKEKAFDYFWSFSIALKKGKIKSKNKFKKKMF